MTNVVCLTCRGDPSSEDHKCLVSERADRDHCNCAMENDICHWCGIEWFADGLYYCPDCGGNPPLSLEQEEHEST